MTLKIDPDLGSDPDQSQNLNIYFSVWFLPFYIIFFKRVDNFFETSSAQTDAQTDSVDHVHLPIFVGGGKE